MIQISKPQVVTPPLSEETILSAILTIDGIQKTVWFKVAKKFEQYLCYERSDAFLIAVLHYAMRNCHDIKCEAPISEDLYYNIEKHFINALAAYNPEVHRPMIDGPISSEPLPCAGAVGTGISCGVDSLHSLACQTELKFEKHNITHLMFNNVGSHGEGEHAQKLFKQRSERPRKFAEEYGFEFVLTDSNLMDVIKQNHYYTHTYSSMFPVYCLQKLFAVYYYASAGYKYHEFSLKFDKHRCCGTYELFSLPLFSTHNLRIYSEGEGMGRLSKVKDIVRYEPSFKYLNVCIKDSDNCGTCEKCIRTMLGLDALGEIEKYRKVFDVEYYKSHRKWYIQQLVNYKMTNHHDYIEMYPYFKNEVTTIMLIKGFFYKFKNNLKAALPRQFKDHLKKQI